MVNTICHLADIHIRKMPVRNEEYRQVFENLYASLRIKKPDRIVIVGDLVHDYLDLQGEQLILAGEFLNSLAEIAPVRITRGNHDCRKKNIKRVDSIKAITKAINNPKIIYYDTTDFHEDDNIVWCVWNHGDNKHINPWKLNKKHQKDTSKTYIDLFHDPINGCRLPSGIDAKSKTYSSIKDFLGDYSMFGDIHKMQYLDNVKKKAYCGSLISQDFAEGDDEFHGYLLWNLKSGVAEEVEVNNEYSFKNVQLSPYVDFSDLDIEIENPTKYMKIRFIWNTLPSTKSNDNMRQVLIFIKNKYSDVISVSHKNNFIESKKMDSNIDKLKLLNITEQTVQHEVFTNYLTKIGYDEKVIDDLIKLDDEILKSISVVDEFNGEWNIVRFGGTNFKSYEKVDINWWNMDGTYQITGENTAGKTSIIGLISYVLYGKTLETETKAKFGDSRFINNRNGAKFCEGYIVIEMNNEFYGIQRRTELKTSKDGSITAAPTSVKYYKLSSHDDEFSDSNVIDNQTEDIRNKTQKRIGSIIGSYDNFHRIVNTTADTLNRILSNDMAEFIDSLLFDSGLDIFDKKLTAFKEYEKKKNSKIRLSCDVEKTTNLIELLKVTNIEIEEKIKTIESINIPEIEKTIKETWEYVEEITKKLYIIDDNIFNLNISETESLISLHTKQIEYLNNRKEFLVNLMSPLCVSYDEIRLNELILEKDKLKTSEFNYKMKIKGVEQEIGNAQHSIEIINGDIFRLKKDGSSKKQEIFDLRESKVCPTCGQNLTPEHQKHIDEKISGIEKVMFGIAENIRNKENIDKNIFLTKIGELKLLISSYEESINAVNVSGENVLVEIGVITNQKNDVIKRREYQNELDIIPLKLKNEELEIKTLNQKIVDHKNSLVQINDNINNNNIILNTKNKIKSLTTDLDDLKENVFILKNQKSENQNKIINSNKLIAEFKIQEYEDMIDNLYKTCVHRNGIPTQMLTEFILPNINSTMENILSQLPFTVWLDTSDLRPKLVYNDRPHAIIDCIGSSGKERTFSSLIIKHALNQINTKTKPTILMLDEVMGKLTNYSVDEFIDILDIIKESTKKIIIIEHNHTINNDYLINVEMNNNGISSATLN